MQFHLPDRPAGRERVIREMVNHDEQGNDRARDRPRILIVDDEPAIVELLVLLFEDEGYDVWCAYDGEQGLRVAKQVHPDLVISDVSMPRLTGLDLLHDLRANGTRETPVILMSAVVREVPANQCLFVPKPFDLDCILSLARAQLAAR